MKILHLIYTEVVAGAEKYLLHLLPGLKQHDIECHLICVCPASSVPAFTFYCNKMQAGGIKTTLLTGRKKNFLTIAKKINDYIRSENINIIHSHLSNADLLAVLVKILYNKKVFIISTKHGYDERYLNKYSHDTKKPEINRNLYYYYTKFLLKNIDLNVATSKGVADLYVRIGLTSKPFYYIHHGIDPIEEKKDEHGQIPSKLQLIIAGRLEKVKGHKFLLDAMPGVLKQFPEVNLLILGSGSEKNNLLNQAIKAGIEKNVTFLGFKEAPYQFISQSNIIIQPSLFESFGLVFIEAFALKVPVIAFDAPAANEIITNFETGLLVPKFDTEALTQKIIYLLKNPAERKRISENAYTTFLHHYTADRMIAQTAEWYKSITFHNS